MRELINRHAAVDQVYMNAMLHPPRSAWSTSTSQVRDEKPARSVKFYCIRIGALSCDSRITKVQRLYTVLHNNTSNIRIPFDSSRRRPELLCSLTATTIERVLITDHHCVSSHDG